MNKMDKLIVDVKLYGETVGSLMWNEKKEWAEFQFYPDYVSKGLDVAPIVMPLKSRGKDFVYTFPSNRNECFKGLPGLIADSLPDKYGNQIIDEWFAANGVAVSRITPLDRLCYVGNRAMGGLEFVPATNINGLDESTVLRMDALVSLADKVYRDRQSFRDCIIREDKTILDILRIGTSAGGAKPKAIIALDEKTNEVRSGQVKAPEGFTYWLLKFDGTTFNENGYKIEHPKGISNIEYAYYRMAKDCGIEMNECRLLKEGDSFHFMTKRFDRKDNGDKIHMQTLAALAHYDRDTRHSYEEGFQVIRKLNLGYRDMEEFFRRMVFNVISRNHDDHTKNHSFLMNEKGRWSLAPAYDLCYSYSPTGRWTSIHQMSVNGKQDDFEWKDLAEVAARMDIKDPDSIIGKTIDVVSRWDDYAQDCGVHPSHNSLIGQNHRLLKKPLVSLKTKQSDSSIIYNSKSDSLTATITDSQIIPSAGDKWKIRCRIDGVQQLGKPLDKQDKNRWNILLKVGTEEEQNEFKNWMAEKYYANELKEKEIDKGMKR